MSEQRKTAIVTGASGGIGRAVAKAFVDHDYNVVLTGTRDDKLKSAAAAMGSPAHVLAVVADVASAADRARPVDSALSRFGRIDVLVNNAGLFEPRPFLEVDEAHLDRFLAINLKGTFFLTQAVIPHLMAVGCGAVINVGTVLVDHAIAGVPTTAPIASKGAIHALTGQLAAEFGRTISASTPSRRALSARPCTTGTASKMPTAWPGCTCSIASANPTKSRTQRSCWRKAISSPARSSRWTAVMSPDTPLEEAFAACSRGSPSRPGRRRSRVRSCRRAPGRKRRARQSSGVRRT